MAVAVAVAGAAATAALPIAAVAISAGGVLGVVVAVAAEVAVASVVVVVVVGSVRLPPRGVVRFLCSHVLKLEFWHFAHPEWNFGFVFASVFAVFCSKKCANRRAALYKNMLSSPFRIVSFGVFLCVCVSHFASVFTFTVFLPTLDFLHMPA